MAVVILHVPRWSTDALSRAQSIGASGLFPQKGTSVDKRRLIASAGIQETILDHQPPRVR